MPVKSIEDANRLFASVLGVPHYKTEDVASEHVKSSFFKTGDNKIELLESTDANGPIAKFIEKNCGCNARINYDRNQGLPPKRKKHKVCRPIPSISNH